MLLFKGDSKKLSKFLDEIDKYNREYLDKKMNQYNFDFENNKPLEVRN